MLKNLRNLRKELGLSQKQVAEKLNISQQTYSDYENDKTEPTMDMLIRLANLFGVSIDELLDRDITAEEYAAGVRTTIKKSITPIEDDMLYAFREVGKKLGEKGQRALIEVAETMAGIK